VTDRLSGDSNITPRLSVVVFVKNAANTIERALKSVLEHQNSSVELLVLDGGSTDGTVEIIRRYQQRIAFWRSFPDGGPEFAIREGIERTTGEVICLLPADDWLEPNALDYVLREFAADPELDVLSCGVRFIHFEGNENLVVDAEFLDPQDLEFNMHNIVRRVLSGGRFIRRRVYRRLGGYNPDYSMSNDLELFIRVILARPKTKILPRLVYTYWQHPESRTMGHDPDMDMAMMRGSIRVAADHLARSPLLPDERHELRGFHGRCCARLAWMLMVRGKSAESVAVLRHAVAENPLWPIQVVYWLFRYVVGSKP
jgi:glycosyltransferase involved in cell wall biosynthesis